MRYANRFYRNYMSLVLVVRIGLFFINLVLFVHTRNQHKKILELNFQVAVLESSIEYHKSMKKLEYRSLIFE